MLAAILATRATAIGAMLARVVAVFARVVAVFTRVVAVFTTAMFSRLTATVAGIGMRAGHRGLRLCVLRLRRDMRDTLHNVRGRRLGDVGVARRMGHGCRRERREGLLVRHRWLPRHEAGLGNKAGLPVAHVRTHVRRELAIHAGMRGREAATSVHSVACAWSEFFFFLSCQKPKEVRRPNNTELQRTQFLTAQKPANVLSEGRRRAGGALPSVATRGTNAAGSSLL